MQPAHVLAYQHRYAGGTFDSAVFRDEADYVRRVVQKLEGPVQHVDLACGTGRWLDALAGQVEWSVGVDNSESMLKVAAAGESKPVLIESTLSDLDRGVVSRPSGSTRVVTLFRYLLNAAADERAAALFTAAKLLQEPKDLLILDNHGRSPSARDLALLAGRGWNNRLKDHDLDGLLAITGLRVLDAFTAAVLPSPVYRLFGVSRAHRLDAALRRGQPAGSRRFGINRIYTLTKA